MRVLGLDVPRGTTGAEGQALTLVALGADGRVAQWAQIGSIPAVASRIVEWAGGEPFVVGIDAPLVVPARPARARPVERLVRRRFGVRLPPGGRAAQSGTPRGLVGETLLGALAALGEPCLPSPDRDRRRSGLAETHPALILKALLWEGSPLADTQGPDREKLFRAYAAAPYHPGPTARNDWASHAVAMDMALRSVEAAAGFDLGLARRTLGLASSAPEVEAAASLLDASLIAGTLRRYLDAPETCLFLGDVESGYLVLPANAFIRRLALTDVRKPREGLFPRDSLELQLGAGASLRPVELLAVPGRPQRTEAGFAVPPRYEFDNVDEMLWWKHCRHLDGAPLPVEGLVELYVSLGDEAGADPVLRLARSRHRTLSFRFEPPSAWRARLPTRDGRTYRLHVWRAVYETAPRNDAS